MEYSKLINKKKQYKYSANINFDLRNEEKLSDFIPNKTTVDILHEYLGGIINHTDVHSRILFGSYGTGKSHLLTVISAILGHINTNKTRGIKNFLGRISKYDAALASDIEKYVSEGKPFLVVPVFSDYSDFNRCITYSLKRALKESGIEAAFKGFFDEALALTEKWVQGEESSKRLAEECAKQKIDIDHLLQGLASYDQKYEKTFDQIYSGMTFGASFHSTDGNLIENLNAANEAIRGKYQGIVIVFDEFGRYVEDYGEEIKVKAIQDLAEYCDHSDYQDYIILVSHKQLSLYTDSMTKSVSEEWKKVEGRFKTTSINTKYDQCLSLVKYIIPKTSRWNEFKNKFATQLQELYEQAWDFKGFYLPPQTDGDNPFEGGFPLHPITLYALDRLSKKVAQNERTFFTYLAGDEENSLFSQLSKLDDSEFHFIGLDSLYDYFEINIKAYKTGDAYVYYKKLRYAINKLGENAEDIKVKILKAMAVIYIIGDTDVIAADKNTLLHVVDADKRQIEKAIDEMEHSRIIRYMRQYGFYDFFDSSIFDLEKMIDEKLDGISEDTIINVLNDEFSDFVIYPYSYNEHFHMHRVFIPYFAKREDLDKKSFLRTLPPFYDGVLILVLDDRAESSEYLSVNAPDRSILMVNSNARLLEHEVRRYIAIQYYFSKRTELAKEDPTVINELTVYLNEQKSIIDELVRRWRTLSSKDVFVVSDKEVLSITSSEQLSDRASEIMEKVFDKTIIVNNDLLNKNQLSGAMKQARAKAINYIISNQNDIYDGCQVLSPEFNVLRSTLTNTGVYKGGKISAGKIEFLKGTNEPSGVPAMNAISAFLEDATKGPKNLNDLYGTLKSEPLGLRDGYIAGLIAFALREYENVSIYFHGKEHDYSPEELVKAIDDVEDYAIFVSNWSEEQENYIKALEEIFKDYIVAGQNQNRLSALFSAMNTHYAGISKSARTTEHYVSDFTKKYRDIMNLSYGDITGFFFEVLPKLNPDLEELVIQIQSVKKDLEDVPQKQLGDVTHLLREILGINSDETIIGYVETKYESTWKDKSSRAFDYITNAFLDLVGRKDYDNEADFVRKLAKVISGFEIEYWNDSKIEEFEEGFASVLNRLNDTPQLDSFDDKNVKVTIDTGDKNKIVSEFSKGELSSIGQLMFNKLHTDIENFGESISYEEKINIITRLLRDAIQ